LFYNAIAQIENDHIKYVFDFSSPILPVISTVYILSTVFSPFVSSVKRMNVLGILLMISLLISKLFFDLYTISIWCFFAAIISSVVFSIILNINFSPRIKPFLSEK